MNGVGGATAADLCAPKAFPGAKADVLPKRAASDTIVATMDFILLYIDMMQWRAEDTKICLPSRV